MSTSKNTALRIILNAIFINFELSKIITLYKVFSKH